MCNMFFNYVRCVRDVEATNSINETKKFHFNVYPSPAQNEISISSDYELKTISIFNAVGEKMIELSTSQKELSINTTQLSNGIYFISIISNNGFTGFNKIIIAK